MAITIDDFSKIWASSSPLTPYEFSEDNYKNGWNFVGATPPSRQMWDFLQKNNDEKMQYLADNYLPLSGGTMTGDIALNGAMIVNSTDNTYTTVCGGTDDSGSYLRIHGKNSTYAGLVGLSAGDGENRTTLLCTPGGSLTWGGKNIAIANQTFQLSDDLATTFPSGVDLNNYTTAGTYISTGASITNSLSNCPVSGLAFKMLVIHVGYGTIAYGGTQIIFANTGIFARRNSGPANNVAWSAWKTVVSYA